MKQLNVRSTFVVVYAAVSIATFYHSMWGGPRPNSGRQPAEENE